VLGLIAPRGFKSRILRQLAGQTLVALIGWAHETAAAKALRNGETQVAQVPAILALAFAVNRLAGTTTPLWNGPITETPTPMRFTASSPVSEGKTTTRWSSRRRGGKQVDAHQR
jgi:hypothetical protein